MKRDRMRAPPNLSELPCAVNRDEMNEKYGGKRIKICSMDQRGRSTDLFWKYTERRPLWSSSIDSFGHGAWSTERRMAGYASRSSFPGRLRVL